jgi:hypothetical protein
LAFQLKNNQQKLKGVVMDKSNKTLVLETRFILHILLGLAISEDDDFDDLAKEEIVHFLSMAKARVDKLCLELASSGQLPSH